MIKYKKTLQDTDREISDMKRNPIMRFLKNQNHFKFNIGDVIIKQTKHLHTEDWKTELTAIKAPKKFMYVFENDLGIGYLKQLRVDGSGFTSALICTANFDPDNTRFIIDPDYIDHLIVGDKDNFQYNTDYLNKKKFREDAIKSNSKILISTHSEKKLAAWFHCLKVGDQFWMGRTFDDMVRDKYIVTNVLDNPIEMMPSHVLKNFVKAPEIYRTIKTSIEDFERVFTLDCFKHCKLTQQTPYPMKDELCGPQK